MKSPTRWLVPTRLPECGSPTLPWWRTKTQTETQWWPVRGGREAAFRVAARMSLFTRATSLGSYESLIEHRASIEGYSSSTPEDLLRVSVGLENADDLIADLDRALGE